MNPFKSHFTTDFKERTFDVEELRYGAKLPLRFNDLRATLRALGDVVSVEMYKRLVVGPKVLSTIEVKSPANWWEHFKLRWFPSWALKRWPVEVLVQEIPQSIQHVCPHINVPGNMSHIRFLCHDPYHNYKLEEDQ